MPKRTTEEYLEENQPTFEDASMELARLILRNAPREEVLPLAEYISEFAEYDDPRAMGWVGDNGLP